MGNLEIQAKGTGKRKTSVARVVLTPGKGEIKINNRHIEEYFPVETLKMVVKQPLAVTGVIGKYDVFANVQGSGISAQACAVRHGIARALVEINSDFRPKLKKEGLLTRDPRVKERKKYGQKGARKRFQFSKR